MGLVDSWNLKRVYGTWIKQGGLEKRAGTYRVMIPVRVVNATDDVIIPSGTYDTGALNVAPGDPSLDIMVPSTDDVDITPVGWGVTIEITFSDGATNEKYSIPVPVGGGDINLAEVAYPVPPINPTEIYSRGVAGGLATLDADGDVINAGGVKVGDISDELVEQAVEDYLTENPPEGGGGTGEDGAGWTSGSYDETTGTVTFESDDGLGFSTGDLRGEDGDDGSPGNGWTSGSYNPTTGVVTFFSDDGLGFSTGDLRGEDGEDGSGGSGGAVDSVNGYTGVVDLSADDVDAVASNGTITAMVRVTQSEYNALTPDPNTYYVVLAD